MRKQMNRNRTVVFSVIAVIVAMACVPTAFAADVADSYALLVQQSPVEAGTVNPGSGVHKVQIGQTVSLTATPKPGYRFLYWLGDVTAAGTTTTTIQVDSPKMVVAVFTREAYEEELPGVSLIKGATAYGGGASRLVGTPLSSGPSVNPGSYVDYPDYTYVVNYPETTDDWKPNPFVPGDDNGDNSDDSSVTSEVGGEVPEPATVLLLGLGTMGLLRRRTKN